MTSINQDNHKNKATRIHTGFGVLWSVSFKGQKWTPLPLLCDFVGVATSQMIHRMAKRQKHWRDEHIDAPPMGNHRCIPLVRLGEFFSLCSHHIPNTHRAAFAWAEANAFRVLSENMAPVATPQPLPMVYEAEVIQAPAPAHVAATVPSSSTGLNTFCFGGRDVRVVMRGGDPWWIAADVCAVLDLGNPTKALLRLDDEEKSTLISIQGGPDRNIINESGLYSLVLGSRKPEAKAFKKWITSEVIPSIRKTGSYGVQKFRAAGMDLAMPADFSEALMALAMVVKKAEPAIQFQHSVEVSPGSLPVREYFQTLGAGIKTANRWLKIRGYYLLYRNLPMARWIDEGIFETRPVLRETGHHIAEVCITGKGMIRVQAEWSADHSAKAVS